MDALETAGNESMISLVVAFLFIDKYCKMLNLTGCINISVLFICCPPSLFISIIILYFIILIIYNNIFVLFVCQ